MRTARAVASIGTLVVCVALVPAAFAQEAARPDILLHQITPSGESLPSGSTTWDLRDAPPPPRVDKLSDAVRFNAVVGDPRCLPGEELLGPGSINRRSRRPSRSR